MKRRKQSGKNKIFIKKNFFNALILSASITLAPFLLMPFCPGIKARWCWALDVMGNSIYIGAFTAALLYVLESPINGIKYKILTFILAAGIYYVINGILFGGVFLSIMLFFQIPPN